jgi:cytochrome c
MRHLALGIALISVLAAQAQTEDKAAAKTKAEKFVKDAVALAKKSGKDALLRETSQATGRFHMQKGSNLYLFIYNLEGVCVAHGSKPVLVGMNRLDSKDPDGKFYVKEFINTVKTKGKGWVDYKYPDPATGKIQPKSTYVERCDDMVVCAGAY